MTDTNTRDDEEARIVDHAYRQALAKMGGPIDVMRAAIDALDAYRRNQPASDLAEDARKVPEAVQDISRQELTSEMDEETEESADFEGAYDAMILQARRVRHIAESMPARIEALVAERDAARQLVEHFKRQRDLETQEASDQEGLKFVAESQLAAREDEIVSLGNELLAHEGEVAQGKKPSEYMRGFIEGLKRAVDALAAPADKGK